MVNTIIHIGMARTATTMLQREVFAHHSGINYLGKPFSSASSGPQTGTGRRLGEDIIANVWRLDSLAYDGEENKKKLETFFSETEFPENGNPVLISEEGLSGALLADRGLVATRLKELFGQAKILITIRSQFTCVPSLYGHYSRKGITSDPSFDGWLKKVVQPTTFADDTQQWMLRQYRHHDLLRLYQDVFSPSAVKVVMYEQMLEDPAAFSRELSEFLGAEEEESKRLLYDAGQLNRRLSPNGVKLEKTYSTIEAGYRDLRKRFLPGFSLRANAPWLWRLNKGMFQSKYVPSAGLVKPQKAILSEESRKRLLHYYAEDNRALALATGLDLSKYGYPL